MCLFILKINILPLIILNSITHVSYIGFNVAQTFLCGKRKGNKFFYRCYSVAEFIDLIYNYKLYFNTINYSIIFELKYMF